LGLTKKITILLLVLLTDNVYAQRARVCNKSQFDSAYLKNPYSLIITETDTLYSNRIVSGMHLPIFDRKVSGLYLLIQKNDVALKSYVYKGRLTGYYVKYYQNEIIEEGIFTSKRKIILNRK
jgi:hypothetical protein